MAQRHHQSHPSIVPKSPHQASELLQPSPLASSPLASSAQVVPSAMSSTGNVTEHEPADGNAAHRTQQAAASAETQLPGDPPDDADSAVSSPKSKHPAIRQSTEAVTSQLVTTNAREQTSEIQSQTRSMTWRARVSKQWRRFFSPSPTSTDPVAQQPAPILSGKGRRFVTRSEVVATVPQATERPDTSQPTPSVARQNNSTMPPSVDDRKTNTQPVNPQQSDELSPLVDSPFVALTSTQASPVRLPFMPTTQTFPSLADEVDPSISEITFGQAQVRQGITRPHLNYRSSSRQSSRPCKRGFNPHQDAHRTGMQDFLVDEVSSVGFAWQTPSMDDREIHNWPTLPGDDAQSDAAAWFNQNDEASDVSNRHDAGHRQRLEREQYGMPWNG
jgi:hypothetical protein